MTCNGCGDDAFSTPMTSCCDESWCEVCFPGHVNSHFIAPKPPATVIDEAYRSWIRARPCIVCLLGGFRSWGVEACHVRTRRNNGDRENLVPMCHNHHMEQHAIGLRSFCERYEIDLERQAVVYQDWYNTKEELAF